MNRSHAVQPTGTAPSPIGAPARPAFETHAAPRRPRGGSRRWLRWTLAGAAALTSTLLLVAAAGLVMAERRMHRQVEVAVAPIAIPDDAASVARGHYLFESRGCADCHGIDGGGRSFVDQPPLRLAGPDITAGGRTADYRSRDWVRSVRHGVAPDGRPLRIMPSEDYNRLTDADLGALVAYVKQLPPGAGAQAVVELPLAGRLLYGFGLMTDAAARIDHRLPPALPVAEGVTVEHGRYVAQMCTGCHGAGFGGGRIPGSPPDWPAAANLTPGQGGVLARYADAASFARMMRSGQRPDGSRIGVMPFEAVGKLNETDLQALYAFLRALPPREAGSR